jgi:hypothetical protein
LFCLSKELPVYIDIAEALKGMDDASNLLSSVEEDPPPHSIIQDREVAAKTLVSPVDAAFTLATKMVRRHAVVEIPGQ